MKTIQRTVYTRNLITRLYAYGKDSMSFSTINDGKAYVEDFSYSTESRTATLDCSGFINQHEMLEYTQTRLKEYSKPRISYVLNAMDLSVLTDYSHEVWNLGDIVSVRDEELDLFVKTRIVRREYYLQEPWKTVLELSTTLHELSDEGARWDNAANAISNMDQAAAWYRLISSVTAAQIWVRHTG